MALDLTRKRVVVIETVTVTIKRIVSRIVENTAPIYPELHASKTKVSNVIRLVRYYNNVIMTATLAYRLATF